VVDLRRVPVHPGDPAQLEEVDRGPVGSISSVSGNDLDGPPARLPTAKAEGSVDPTISGEVKWASVQVLGMGVCLVAGSDSSGTGFAPGRRSIDPRSEQGSARPQCLTRPDGPVHSPGGPIFVGLASFLLKIFWIQMISHRRSICRRRIISW